HLCSFTAAMLFWRPVILAWPARSPWPRWAMIPYLLLAELQNTILAAILSFSDRVIYPTYAALPPAGALSPLEDQSLAGMIMWVPGPGAFLVPVLWLGVHHHPRPPAGAAARSSAGLAEEIDRGVTDGRHRTGAVGDQKQISFHELVALLLEEALHAAPHGELISHAGHAPVLALAAHVDPRTHAHVAVQCAVGQIEMAAGMAGSSRASVETEALAEPRHPTRGGRGIQVE